MTIDTEPGDLSPRPACASSQPTQCLAQDDVAVTEGLVDSDPVAALLPSVVPGRDNGRMSKSVTLAIRMNRSQSTLRRSCSSNIPTWSSRDRSCKTTTQSM